MNVSAAVSRSQRGHPGKGGERSEPAERHAEEEEEEVVVDSDATVNDSASKNKATAVVL